MLRIRHQIVGHRATPAAPPTQPSPNNGVRFTSGRKPMRLPGAHRWWASPDPSPVKKIASTSAAVMPAWVNASLTAFNSVPTRMNAHSRDQTSSDQILRHRECEVPTTDLNSAVISSCVGERPLRPPKHSERPPLILLGRNSARVDRDRPPKFELSTNPDSFGVPVSIIAATMKPLSRSNPVSPSDATHDKMLHRLEHKPTE